tara:strand:- start:477 stop:1106 length:630 start_codon:yes stop_codon:yes gene_type:complete
MSITTLAELKTALDTETSRTDIDWSDYITRGEARLNRKLRLLSMQSSTTFTLSSGDSTQALPSDFIEHIDLFYTSDNYQPTQQSLYNLQETASTGTGRPYYFAIGSVIEFERSADQDYGFTHRYYKKFDLATDNTNTLLTTNPDVYIYSTLAAFYMRAKDATNVQFNLQLLDNVVIELNTMDGRSRSQARVAVDTGLAPARVFDVNRGY